MTKRKTLPRPRRKRPFIDRILTPSLEERTAAILRKGLPPDADEFDRVCFEIMTDFMRMSAELHKAKG